MAVLDTHELVEELVASGIKKKQAEVITKAVKQSSNHLVTVSDLELALVKQKVELLKWIVPIGFNWSNLWSKKCSLDGFRKIYER